MKYLFPLSPWNQQRQFEKPVWVYPVHLAMYATYLWKRGEKVGWGQTISRDNQYLRDRVEIKTDCDIPVSFDKLPFPDRVFTDAKNPRWQKYGNYKYHPATHMMVSNLCWYGKCSFCVDHAKIEAGEKRYVRTLDHVFEEFDDLERQGYKEVFDDSGTFPIDKWLKDFCLGMIDRGNKIKIGCNMRALPNINYEMMSHAGFRLILVGLESGNQSTLDQINKGQDLIETVAVFKRMSEAGLEPHAAVMFGYPFETVEDADRTIALVHELLKAGYVKTVQASVYSEPRTQADPKSMWHKYIQKTYSIYRNPIYWWTKIKDIKHWEDFTYLVKRINLIHHAK